MGLLDFFFGNKISEPVDQKLRTGFRNQYGEELSEYLTEGDVQVFNYAVDGSGTITTSIGDILTDAEIHEAVFASEIIKLESRLARAGLSKEDACRLSSVVSRWAMGVRR